MLLVENRTQVYPSDVGTRKAALPRRQEQGMVVHCQSFVDPVNGELLQQSPNHHSLLALLFDSHSSLSTPSCACSPDQEGHLSPPRHWRFWCPFILHHPPPSGDFPALLRSDRCTFWLCAETCIVVRKTAFVKPALSTPSPGRSVTHSMAWSPFSSS